MLCEAFPRPALHVTRDPGLTFPAAPGVVDFCDPAHPHPLVMKYACVCLSCLFVTNHGFESLSMGQKAERRGRADVPKSSRNSGGDLRAVPSQDRYLSQ